MKEEDPLFLAGYLTKLVEDTGQPRKVIADAFPMDEGQLSKILNGRQLVRARQLVRFGELKQFFGSQTTARA